MVQDKLGINIDIEWKNVSYRKSYVSDCIVLRFEKYIQ